LQPKKQTSANRRHRLESPLQLPGTTVVREPPSAHKREQGDVQAEAKPRATPAETTQGCNPGAITADTPVPPPYRHQPPHPHQEKTAARLSRSQIRGGSSPSLHEEHGRGRLAGDLAPGPPPRHASTLRRPDRRRPEHAPPRRPNPACAPLLKPPAAARQHAARAPPVAARGRAPAAHRRTRCRTHGSPAAMDAPRPNTSSARRRDRPPPPSLGRQASPASPPAAAMREVGGRRP
jgi:hypothetical protein